MFIDKAGGSMLLENSPSFKKALIPVFRGKVVNPNAGICRVNKPYGLSVSFHNEGAVADFSGFSGCKEN